MSPARLATTILYVPAALDFWQRPFGLARFAGLCDPRGRGLTPPRALGAMDSDPGAGISWPSPLMTGTRSNDCPWEGRHPGSGSRRGIALTALLLCVLALALAPSAKASEWVGHPPGR